MCRLIYHTVCMWRSEGNLWKLVLTFYFMGCGPWIELSLLGLVVRVFTLIQIPHFSLNTQTTASWPRGWALKGASGNLLLFWCVNSQWALCQLESCIAFEVISFCTKSHGLGGPGTHLSRSSNLQQKNHLKNPPMTFRPGRHIILKGSLSLAFINCKLRRKPLNSTPFHE